MTTQELCEFTNKVSRLSIPVELFEKRNEFCPSKGRFTCAGTCPIYRKYYGIGLSCNQALDRHPDDCVAMMTAESEGCV